MKRLNHFVTLRRSNSAINQIKTNQNKLTETIAQLTEQFKQLHQQQAQLIEQLKLKDSIFSQLSEQLAQVKQNNSFQLYSTQQVVSI